MVHEPPQGAKISAYILFALGALSLLALCILIVVLGLAASSGEAAEQLAGPIIGACFSIVFAALYGAVGYGVLKLQSWARIAAIVIAVLSLCSFPFGTIGGGIVLYYMFQPDVSEAFA